MGYVEEAGTLWRRYVPSRGQADTVQGELIRAVEKLRDEAQRNGNINWDEGHAILAEYLRSTLIGSGLFDGDAGEQIEADVARLREYEHPASSDELYDRLTERVVEWSRAHPDPVPREPDPRLHR
jgi:hypothetical protein